MNRYLIGGLVGIGLAGRVLIEVTVDPGTVEVPWVAGLDLRDVQDELTGVGLQSAFTYNVRRGEDATRRTSAASSRRRSSGSWPAAGTEVDRGTTVDLRMIRQR